MAATNQMTTALLTEHLRWTPLTLLDEIINTVNELAFRAINGIEEGLASHRPEDLGFSLSTEQAQSLSSDEEREEALLDLKQKEIDNGVVQLETLLNAIIDKDFDKFEIYTLRNILAIGHEEDGDLAQWVRLDHYKDLDVQREESSIGPEELQLQRRKLQETAKLNAMLKAEEAKNAAVLEQLQALVGGKPQNEGAQEDAPFGFLLPSAQNQTGQLASHTAVQDMQYAVSQLPALRQLLGQLKTSLGSLPSARAARLDEGSAEAKRRDYLDTQSMRALDKRGVQRSATRSPDFGSKRRIGKEEVEGMEAVVQALGGARKDFDDMEQ